MAFSFKHTYEIDPDYAEKVAYFCMEVAIQQPLKTYAGGLGFLAGSHMRSAYELRQNIIGISILWKYGYYDQTTKQDQTMDVRFAEKNYGFLQATDIKFTISISQHNVRVTAYYLKPEIFNTAPIFFLSTDLPENDYLAQTICHKLYDSNPETRIASAILLGEGGAKLLEAIKFDPSVYHLNESHALPLAFYLYRKFGSVSTLKKHLVFTNHTPEEAGNQKTELHLLERMGFFSGIPLAEIKAITGCEGNELNHTLSILRLSKKANGVSKRHLQTLKQMWAGFEGICDIVSITNAQNFSYWHDEDLYKGLKDNNNESIQNKKKSGKKVLFEIVADQCGEIYDEKVFTIVFAKRFATYKRADLLLQNMERFHQLVTNKKWPVQIIWAGKPYPMDYPAIALFDRIVNITKTYPNCAILVGYELKLSKIMKLGADIWLNVPLLTHEASGTSGITAAMNGAVNVALPDGWFPEFANDKINSFIISPGSSLLSEQEQNEKDASDLYDLLEKEVLPLYYYSPRKWIEIIKNGLTDIRPLFDSNRMAKEYYEKLYLV